MATILRRSRHGNGFCLQRLHTCAAQQMGRRSLPPLTAVRSAEERNRDVNDPGLLRASASPRAVQGSFTSRFRMLSSGVWMWGASANRTVSLDPKVVPGARLCWRISGEPNLRRAAGRHLHGVGHACVPGVRRARVRVRILGRNHCAGLSGPEFEQVYGAITFYLATARKWTAIWRLGSVTLVPIVRRAVRPIRCSTRSWPTPSGRRHTRAECLSVSRPTPTSIRSLLRRSFGEPRRSISGPRPPPVWPVSTMQPCWPLRRRTSAFL